MCISISIPYLRRDRIQYAKVPKEVYLIIASAASPLDNTQIELILSYLLLTVDVY